MAENKVKDGNYYVVQSFMVKDLKLKGLEKDVYAIIYGFSQAENQTFTGSLQYLADWTNSTKQGILKTLNSLVDKGLIARKENIINNVKFVEYYSTEFNRGIKQSLMGDIKQSLINNIDNNNITDKIENKVSKKESKKSFDEIIAENFENEKVKTELIEFIKMRKQIKKPMTNRALEILIKKLKEMSNNDCDLMVKLLDQSIEHGWQTIYELKDNKTYQNPAEEKPKFIQNKYSKEELDGLFDNIDDIKLV